MSTITCCIKKHPKETQHLPLALEIKLIGNNKNNLQAFPPSTELKLKFRWICQNRKSTMTLTYFLADDKIKIR